MAEKIYTIPVNEAFDKHSECPICSMYVELEDNAIDFMMGSSYMEDDIRMETDRLGFCKTHMTMLAKSKNRLGLSLILKTHLDKQKKDCEKIGKFPLVPKTLLNKKSENPYADWAMKASCNCYICNRINAFFPRYIDTALQLYRKDPEFRLKYESCKGFCQEHFGLLMEKGQEVLNRKELADFSETTRRLYLENIQRLSDDLDWFQDKFDYRHKDDPWKDSKDAIERAVVKTNGVIEREEKK